MINRLALRLETVGGTVVTLASLFAVVQRGSIDPGFAGLSIVYGLQLTSILNWMVRTYTTLETNMISVERVLNYSRIPIETLPTTIENTPPESWPTDGVVEFKNVELRYREGLELVLKGTSFLINSKEKIGIVGRTGAGMFTLIINCYCFFYLFY